MEVFLIRLLQFLLAISLLVLLHELGHFTFAKIFKVRVNKFYLFFNPKFHIVSTYDTWVRRLFKMKPEVVPTKEVEVETKKGEAPKKVLEKEYVGTEYGLGWLPLGGYCAIDGMIDETNQQLSEETHPWEFRTKPTWQRLLIMIGGVLVNFLLALFIYSMVLYHWGDDYIEPSNMTMGMKFNDDAKALGFKDGDILLSADGEAFKKFDIDLYRTLSTAHEVEIKRNGQTQKVNLPGDMNLLNMLKATPTFVAPLIPAEIDSVLPGTPAEKAGMKAGDRILSINGQAVDSWNEFTYEMGRISDVLAVKTTRADSLRERQVQVSFLSKEKGEADTVRLQLTPDLKLGVLQANLYTFYKETHCSYGFFESFPAGIQYGLDVLRGYVGDMKYVFTSEGAKSLGGFGAIGSLFPPVWDWMLFWRMTAFLSIILAFMNILPIPALDGGHVLFLLYEMVTGRKPSDKFMVVAEYIGFGFILLLMIVANLNDILRWLGMM